MLIVFRGEESVFARIEAVVAAGHYPSVGDFVKVAVENQLSLEAREDSAHHVEARPRVPVVVQGLGIPSTALKSSLLPTPEEASRRPESDGWVWGLVNRILPIKVAARSLLNDSVTKLPAFTKARATAADRASSFARGLNVSPALRQRQTVLVGFPTRPPLAKARDRFANQYFGRIDGEGRLWGALFELGLANINPHSAKSVGLTQAGYDFAVLNNPTIDEGRLDEPVSDAEADFYLTRVAAKVPRERHCFITLLGALAESDHSVEELNAVCRDALPKRLSAAAAQAMKAGALGRLIELRLISRRQDGREAWFSIEEDGRAALRVLRVAPLVTE
jgi:Arc/MetJ-type ribon-helix-helix transcriptional regulator